MHIPNLHGNSFFFRWTGTLTDVWERKMPENEKSKKNYTFQIISSTFRFAGPHKGLSMFSANKHKRHGNIKQIENKTKSRVSRFMNNVHLPHHLNLFFFIASMNSRDSKTVKSSLLFRKSTFFSSICYSSILQPF